MKKLTESEWSVLDVLWSGDYFSLGEVVDQMLPVTGWSRNTVFTYLTRMEKKQLVAIDRSRTQPYSAAVSRADCAKMERRELLGKVYGGATGDLIAAFLKDSVIPSEERDRLRKMLDDMEV